MPEGASRGRVEPAAAGEASKRHVPRTVMKRRPRDATLGHPPTSPPEPRGPSAHDASGHEATSPRDYRSASVTNHVPIS